MRESQRGGEMVGEGKKGRLPPGRLTDPHAQVWKWPERIPAYVAPEPDAIIPPDARAGIAVRPRGAHA